jgi:hypothetical protein
VSAPRRTVSGAVRLALGLALALAPLAGVAQPASSSELADCARLGSDAERLACYDRLAGRASAAPVPAPAAAAPVTQTAPAMAAPSMPAAAPAAATPAAAAPAAAAPAAAAPAAGPSFGLYSAEHPRPPPVSPSLVARVSSVGRSASGRMTVTVEGGALWELLDEADPLLAAGDAVSITRASFGSYLMHTPSARVHRVHRLR